MTSSKNDKVEEVNDMDNTKNTIGAEVEAALQPAAAPPLCSKEQVMREMTLDYLNSIDVNNPPAPEEMASGLIEMTADAFELRNAVCLSKNRKWAIPDALRPAQIADLMLNTRRIVRVCCMDEATDNDYDLLAIYQTDGPNEGIYVTSESVFRELARRFSYKIDSRGLKEIMLILQDKAPRVIRCDDRDLVAVNNGVFNYSTKQLMPFSPDYVFLSKSRVNYVDNPVNPVIHNPDDNTAWDVESWMNELTDDADIINLLWEIIGAVIRPNVRWNKSAWFYSPEGSNGKGTLCELMRNVCGKTSCTSIPLDSFGKEFALEPLIRVSAIITDENDTGTFIDKAANLKAIITNDTIQINRKFKQPIAYQFKGFMVQCLNEMPRVKDKSDSFYRRQVFVPFLNTFKGSNERRYIKDFYIRRQDVLEYVLWKVLNMDCYALSEPAACRMALDEYKEYNDPVRQFWNEFSEQFVWELLPFTFLYDLFKKWYDDVSPKGGCIGKTTFIQNLAAVLKNDAKWKMPDKDKDNKYNKTKTSNRMDKPEYLIFKYDLKNWMEKGYTGKTNPDRVCTPVTQDSYRGVIRR